MTVFLISQIGPIQFAMAHRYQCQLGQFAKGIYKDNANSTIFFTISDEKVALWKICVNLGQIGAESNFFIEKPTI